MNEILECCDCNSPFCTVCDFDHTHCPDCTSPMCESCSSEAREKTQGRCYTCNDPDLADTLYPGGVDWKTDRKIYKHYTQPVKGKLPCE